MDLKIKNITFITDNETKYCLDVHYKNTIASLKKIIAAAANLNKKTITLTYNGIEYRDMEDQTLEQLFPNITEIIFIIGSRREALSKGEFNLLHQAIKRISIGPKCERHTIKYPNHYCFTCNKSICNLCKEEVTHNGHIITDKMDFLSDSEVIVNDIFRDITSQLRNLNLDNQEEINKLKSQINNFYFPTLIAQIKKIQEDLLLYISKFENNVQIARSNMLDNVNNLESNCTEGLDELKNKISIKDILINEDIFLTFNAKLIQMSEEQNRIEKDSENYLKYCNVINLFSGETVKIYKDIKLVLDKIMKFEDFEELLNQNGNTFVQRIDKEEVINNILSNTDSKISSVDNKNSQFRKSVFPSHNIMNNNAISQNQCKKYQSQSPFKNEIIEHTQNMGNKELSEKVDVNDNTNLDGILQIRKFSDNDEMKDIKDIKVQEQNNYKLYEKDSELISNSIENKENQNKLLSNSNNNDNVYVSQAIQESNVNQFNQLSQVTQLNHQSQANQPNYITQPIQVSNINNVNVFSASREHSAKKANYSIPQTQTQNSFYDIHEQENDLMSSTMQEIVPSIIDSSNKKIHSDKIVIMRVFPDTDQIAVYYNSTEQVQKSSVSLNPILGTKKFLFNSHWVSNGQKLYISGGMIEIDSRMKGTNLLLCYDNATKTVKRLADMSVPRHSHSSIYYSDNLYIVGGYLNNTCEKFDIKSMKWRPFPSLISVERQTPILHVYNNYLYSFFGYKVGFYLDTIERVSLKANKKWEVVAYKNPQNINLKVVFSGIIPSNLSKSEIYIFGGKSHNGKEEIIRNDGFIFNFEDYSFQKTEFQLEEATYFNQSQLVDLGNSCWAEFNMKQDQVLRIEIN